jgi:hypothetical protein
MPTKTNRYMFLRCLLKLINVVGVGIADNPKKSQKNIQKAKEWYHAIVGEDREQNLARKHEYQRDYRARQSSSKGMWLCMCFYSHFVTNYIIH